MIFTDVLRADVEGDRLTAELLGADDHTYVVTLSAEVRLMLALRQAATRLPHRRAVVEEAFAYQVVGCQPLASSDQVGVALLTAEGLEIPLLLDRTARAGLRAAIDELETGIPQEGPVH